MPAIKLGSRNLLLYDATYGVLICRECQYAIQKSALQSHLLRHKIYRNERQTLLFSIALLNLFEPDKVPLPALTSPPFDTLPVISGYCCTAPECGNLCASIKRMRKHWSEIHGTNDAPSEFSSLARPANLQTFFRGTKLRYFEVASLPITSTAEEVQLLTTNDDVDDFDDDMLDVARSDRGSTTPLQPTDSVAPIEHPMSISSDFDMDILTYFYHFISTASLILPSPRYPQPIAQYWQTDVVAQALQRRWLMSGLLAISASHLAALADDITIRQTHHERFAQYFSQFSAGLEEILNPNIYAELSEVEEKAKKAGCRLKCILSCAQWAFAKSTLDGEVLPESAASFKLQSFMEIIRSSMVPDFALASGETGTQLDDGNNYRHEVFAQAKEILESRSSSDISSLVPFSSGDNTLFSVLKRLDELPYRIAKAFPNPDSAQDVFATLSAIGTLVECCSTSSESNEGGAAWWSMATWLTKLSDRFNNMVSQHNPTALVVLAHWAALLVKRAEYCGCWYVNGTAEKIMSQIVEQLPANDREVHGLIKNLMAGGGKIRD